MNGDHKALVISIEGLDGCFKHTNAKRLYEFLRDHGKEAFLYSFPNYGSNSAYFVTEYLKGEYKGIINDNDASGAMVKAFFYAIDRLDSFKKENIFDLLEDPDNIIIFDRYCMSNLYFQTANVESDLGKLSVAKIICDIEHRTLNLPYEDLSIMLTMPIEESKKVIEKRGNNDIHENDFNFLEKVHSNVAFAMQAYTSAASSYNNGDGVVLSELSVYNKEKNEMYSEDEIFIMILKTIDTFLEKRAQSGKPTMTCTVKENEENV